MRLDDTRLRELANRVILELSKASDTLNNGNLNIEPDQPAGIALDAVYLSKALLDEIAAELDERVAETSSPTRSTLTTLTPR